MNDSFDYLERDPEFRYMLLGRMRSDCDYFLGNGGRNEKDLWGGNIERHIEIMEELYYSFPKSKRPDWISIADIESYAIRMKSNPKRYLVIWNTNQYFDDSDDVRTYKHSTYCDTYEEAVNCYVGACESEGSCVHIIDTRTGRDAIEKDVSENRKSRIFGRFRR